MLYVFALIIHNLLLDIEPLFPKNFQSQFFSQHNCNTSDAQKKYNSRAAQLYREKLSQAAQNSLKTNKEVIFFV